MTSKEKIVAAAGAEFAEKGLHGTRIERVAARAEVNKALVYRHFGGKEGLFEATLARQIAARSAFAAALPERLGDVLSVWAARQAKDRDFIHLIVEEGLRHGAGDPIVADGARRDYYARQIADIRARQAAGQAPADLAPEALFFALLLLTIGPVVLPQIAELTLGPEPEKAWEAFLSAFGEAMAAN